MAIALDTAAIGIVVLCAAWLGGCDDQFSTPLVPALRPLYTNVDSELDSGLTGTWNDDENDLKMAFEPDEQQHRYTLTVFESDDGKGTRSKFTAHLVRLGSDSFLDLYPEEFQDGGTLANLHFLPMHSFVRMELDGDKLRLAFLSADWLKDRIADNTVDTPHEVVDGYVLLTGSTEDLQNLAFLYGDDAKAFSMEVNLLRVQSSAASD